MDIINRIRSLGDRIKMVVHSKLHNECTVLDSFGLSYSVIPNGVDSSEFLVHQRTIPSKHKFITVANCFPGKGHEHVLSALNMLHAEGLNFSWTVFCTTPRWHIAKRATMMIMTACSKAPFETSFMLDRERSLMCKSMRSSTLMLHGSVSEVAPLVVLEAMAAGVPWVAFDVGNVAELKGGLVAGPPPIASGDDHVKRFAGVISVLVRKISKIYEECSASGVNLARSSFDWNSILPTYKEILLGK
jgi:glycosyltransferase involved in cell wall biosynthesis